MIFRRIYSVWVIFSIALYFFVFILPLLICVTFQQFHRAALKMNQLWARAFFRTALLPLECEWKFKLDANQQYIVCANHFSYLDIPALGVFPIPLKFVGKSQLRSIPLFGYMYNKLHITVNRTSYRSRAQSLLRAREELAKGFSLGLFPEGGIRSKNIPNMVDFKDGAFILSAESGLPIVPVTMPNNHNILYDDSIFDIARKPCKIIYHPPVYPSGNSDEAVRELKQKVFHTIQSELNKCVKNEDN